MNPSRRRLVQSRVVANGDDSSDSEDSSSSDDSSSEDDTLNARRQALIKKRMEQASRYVGENADTKETILAQALHSAFIYKRRLKPCEWTRVFGLDNFVY